MKNTIKTTKKTPFQLRSSEAGAEIAFTKIISDPPAPTLQHWRMLQFFFTFKKCETIVICMQQGIVWCNIVQIFILFLLPATCKTEGTCFVFVRCQSKKCSFSVRKKGNMLFFYFILAILLFLAMLLFFSF